MSDVVRARILRIARTSWRIATVGAVALAGWVVPAVLVADPLPVFAVGGPIDLGAAAGFSVLTPAAVGNTVSAPGAHHTTLRGDLGAGGAVTGFPPGVVTGIVRSGTDLTAPLADLGTAFSAAANRSPALPLAGDLIGLTLHAGVYNNAGAVANTGIVTLDGQGNPNGVFVFQVGGALGMAASSKVVLVNGVQASHVFWQVNGAATVGAGATVAGTVMAHDAIGVGAGALVNGRMLAMTGAVALNDNDFFSNPPMVTITGGVAATINTATPTITGTTDVVAPATVSVSVAGQNFAAAVVDGAWSVSPAALANATYQVTASAVDLAGNIGGATQALTVDTVVPVVTIDGGAVRLTNDATPTISGSSDVAAGTLISVTVAGVPSTTLVQGNGSWNVTPAALSDGTRVVVVVALDAAGNAGSASQSLTVDTTPALVSIAGGAEALSNDATPHVVGTADVDAGTTLVVVVEGQTLTTTVTAIGAWAVTVAPLNDGVHYITVTTTDAAGNVAHATQTLTIDTVSPHVAIVGGITFGTSDSSPTIRGTSDVASGTVVTVSIAGQAFTTLVQQDGTWNVTPLPLSNGTYVAVVTVVDPAGNPGSATQTMTIDTNAATVTTNGGATPVTHDSTPAISGTSSAAPGSTVTVTIDGQVLTTTVQADGTWTVTPTVLPDGSYTVVVSITDPKGITNTAVVVLTVVTGVGPSGFTPIGPVRVFDTRPAQSPDALRSVAFRKVGGTYELVVSLTGLSDLVPGSGVAAVSLNVTATNAAGDGYVTVYACGAREVVSSLNVSVGRNVANTVVTPVSASGTVCFYSNVATDLVVDINGWFATGSAFTTVGPKRVFDTRPGQSPDALIAVTGKPVQTDTMIEVPIAGLAGYVPATDVSTVSLNVTATNPVADGYVTVYSCATREVVSSVNFVAGGTVANAVMAPISAQGTVCFYASATTDLVVDINGWFRTGSGFSGVNPKRVLDTRIGQSPEALRNVPKVKVGAGNILEVKVTDLAEVVPATGVAAVSINVTATAADSAGYITIYACDTRRQVSSVNYVTGQTVANAVIAPVSGSGTICIYSQVPADIIIDINGWFAAPPPTP